MSKSTIWVGMDVHARTIAIAELKEGAKEPRLSEIPNRPAAISAWFAKRANVTVYACYEAGPCGFTVARQLETLGVACEVIAPSLIPSKPGERIKTDRRDATKLARLLRAGELTSVVLPTSEDEAARDLVRAREDARRDRTAARQRLGKFLLRHGRHWSDGCSWTQKHWAWVRQQHFEYAAERLTFEHYVARVEHLDTAVAQLEKAIEELSKVKRYAARVERLTCLRGISVLSAMVLVTELGDLKRFNHPRQLMAYVGLVPRESSSGTKEWRGGITKTGNSHARRILVEAAWAYRNGRSSLSPRARRAAANQPPAVGRLAIDGGRRLATRYVRLVSRGKKPQVAATAVARELCGFVWALGKEAA